MNATKPATPLPWRVGDAGFAVFGPPNGKPSPATVAPFNLRADAAYIVQCANAYPRLLAEAELLRKQRAELKAALRACVEPGMNKIKHETAARALLARLGADNE